MTTLTDEMARAMFPRSPNYGPHQVYTRKAIAVFARWLREPRERDDALLQATWLAGLTHSDAKRAFEALATHIEGEGK